MRTIETDVCVVGSGISGILVALKIAPHFERITVLERGKPFSAREGFARKMRGEDAYPKDRLEKGYYENSGRHEVHDALVSLVGGSTQAWWGHAPRFCPADFRMKSLYGVGVDWPISYEDLEPYLCEAEEEMGIAGDSAGWPWHRSRPYPLPAHPLSPHEEILAEELEGLGVPVASMPLGRPSRPIGGRRACCGTAVCSTCGVDAKYTTQNTHLPRAAATGKIEIVAGVRANLLRAERGRIRSVDGHDIDGRPVTVRARLVVLAAAALDNVRILLNSEVASEAFCASASTGKYFMEHPDLELHGVSSRDLRHGYGPTPSNGVSYALWDGPFRETRAAGLVELFNWRLKEGQIAEDLLEALRGGRSQPDAIAHARGRLQGRFYLGFQMEQLPEERNQVTLSRSRRDPYGFPYLDIALDAWPEYVARGAQAWRDVADRLVKELEATEVEYKERPTFVHFLGCHRMGLKPEDSVIDSNLRYHHYDNLFVVGGGVFPTGSAANPTVTLAALSLRCGDHIAANRSSW